MGTFDLFDTIESIRMKFEKNKEKLMINHKSIWLYLPAAKFLSKLWDW